MKQIRGGICWPPLHQNIFLFYYRNFYRDRSVNDNPAARLIRCWTGYKLNNEKRLDSAHVYDAPSEDSIEKTKEAIEYIRGK